MQTDEAVFAKCAWRLVPFVVLLFTVNFLDRVNVGFAALTMNQDLGFSPSVFGVGAGIFFVGYFLFEVPGNLVLARVGARRWICFIMAVWGAVSAACAFVQDAPSFYVLRFLLGTAEAGFFPGVLYYLTLWFPRFYRARFAASLIAAGPLAAIIGGPLSSVLLSMNGVFGLHGWQWLFLIEGLPASLLAFSILRVMPDSPSDARWLTSEEKATIARHLATEETSKEHALWPALRDPRVWVLGIVAFGMQSGLFGIGIWLPQIVQSMGFSPMATGFVIVPPYIISATAMIFWGRASDQAGERVRHLALAAFVGAAGLLAAGASQDTRLLLATLTVGMIGVHATFGPFWGAATSFLSDRAAAGGVALINSVGSLGGLAAPAYIGFLRQYTGSYSSGMALMAAELVASGVIVLALGRVLPTRASAVPQLDGRSPAQ
jgi:ACS family tartrate transporter-like MFS transporter